MPMQSQTEWATIGKIVAPFGLRGEVKVLSLSDIPDRFVKLTVAYLSPDCTCYPIESVRPYKGDMVIMKFGGIDDANAAERLRNRDLYIPLEKLAKLPPDSYYQHDIIGLPVSTLDGTALGTITDIMVTGSNDVYIVKAPDGRQILLPAIKEVVKQVDLIRRVMYIHPMRGLLDDKAAVVAQGAMSEEEEP